ncbi:acetyl-coenzyme A carboxylase carboxyl transferase subunit alpha [Ligilactobacillus ceti DSM 22408]|uniref:acetyl-CoA carboxytransferase n=1 Tax=Ligilactobacillus ceti DSM 22408 TaxID=1122146 RepID=A0A0R2KI69_9LACO|nr:acetyl-coenzyme A carboxylase carboxyl transferase subunit alpha [Ligilactobacillus ceti DSM 22408]
MIEIENKTAFEIVKAARSQEKVTAHELITGLFTDFFEIHGDRRYADDLAIIGGLATFEGQPVTVIATDKGTTPSEKQARHFGCPTPAGYHKALRLMQQAEKFQRPVIIFINTPGAYPGQEAEEKGQGLALATELLELSTLAVPIITIIYGEGGSGGALALACGDRVWMLENSIYSVLSPEGFATILWKDVKKVAQASEAMKLTPVELYKQGVIDGIIPENEHRESLYQAISATLSQEINNLKEMNKSELIAKRKARFRKF